MGRKGLSKVVNHLLKLENNDDEEEDISFDFLVKGHLLRMPLDKLITRLSLSTEDIITVEYFPAVSISDESMTCDMPAWVSSISAGFVHLTDPVLVSGCYDGFIRFTEVAVVDNDTMTTSGSSVTMSNTPQHEGPIKDMKTFIYNDYSFILSCGKDHDVKCFMSSTSNKGGMKKKGKLNPTFEHIANLSGHLSSVNCMDVCSSSKKVQVVSGDWNGNVLVYKLNDLIDKAINIPVATNSTKKSKLNTGESRASGVECQNIISTALIHAHSQAITGIQLFNYESVNDSATHMITGSHDHSLKIWDLETQDNILTYNTSKVITSLHYSNINKLILTSHPDDKIRLYDSRQSTAINNESHLNNQSCLKTFYSNTSVNSALPPQWIAQVWELILL